MNREFKLRKDTEFITLSQLLKMEGIVQSGGEVRFYLEDNVVLVNDIIEVRRGKKLRVGDKITIGNEEIHIVGV